MKELIFNTPWTWIRWVRLVMGVSLLISLFFRPDTIMGLFGGILLYQGLFNAGCGASGCAAPINNKKIQENSEEIDFEEIK